MYNMIIHSLKYLYGEGVIINLDKLYTFVAEIGGNWLQSLSVPFKWSLKRQEKPEIWMISRVELLNQCDWYLLSVIFLVKLYKWYLNFFPAFKYTSASLRQPILLQPSILPSIKDFSKGRLFTSDDQEACWILFSGKVKKKKIQHAFS